MFEARQEARRRRLNDAVRIGDMFQSEASRLAEFVNALDQCPYEVRMAALGVESAVAEWTELRRSWSGLRC